MRTESEVLEYPVKRAAARPPHGNTRTGLPFYKLEVGEFFEVPPEEYTRTNSARAHYQKKMWNNHKLIRRFSSNQIRDERTGRIKAYRFTREK